MKRLFFITVASVLLFACSSKKNETVQNSGEAIENSIEQTKIDSLKSNKITELQNLITKYGSILEIKTYNVGKFKNVKFNVDKMTNINSSTVDIYANIEINYEDRYYYYRENALILQDEIQDFINVIEKIKNNYANTAQDTETIVGYISSGNMRIRAIYKNDKWKYDLHVNYRKDDAGISFTQDDFDVLISMFKKVDEKINELNNK